MQLLQTAHVLNFWVATCDAVGLGGGAGVDEEVVNGLLEEIGSGSAELQQVASEQIRCAAPSAPAVRFWRAYRSVRRASGEPSQSRSGASVRQPLVNRILNYVHWGAM